jgi:hypothetical protein
MYDGACDTPHARATVLVRTDMLPSGSVSMLAVAVCVRHWLRVVLQQLVCCRHAACTRAGLAG